jgi:hypothetical protein
MVINTKILNKLKTFIMKIRKGIQLGISLLAVFGFISGCQKMNRPELGDFPKDNQVLPPGDLRFFVPFEGTNPISKWNMADSISKNPAFTTSLTTVAGVSGKSFQGADGAAIKYLNANDIKNATSLTIAFWVKRAVNNKTEFYFGLAADAKDYWAESNLFMLVEHGTATAATLKVYMDDKWFEFPDGSQFPRPLLDGNWHHLAIVYSEATSKMSYYFDGGLVPAPASATTNSGQVGPIKFKSAGSLVIGGWNKHAGLGGPKDDWISSFPGGLDQFRLYNKALTASDIQALYNSKQ